MNPIIEQFINYLSTNGFEIYRRAGILATNKENKLIIINNRIDVYEWYDGEDGQRSAGFFHIHSFSGLDQLNLPKFGLLMHVCNVIKPDAKQMRSTVEIAEEKYDSELNHSHVYHNY